MSGPVHALAPTSPRRWILLPAAAVTVALTLLIVANTLPYYSFSRDFAFLAEKGPLVEAAWWRACFYTHISGGMVCLLIGPFMLWNGLLRRALAIHKWLGRGYGLAVLGWAGPSGVILSMVAKGGLPGRACFLLLCVLWIGTTALGIRAVLARRIPEHRRWMVRSYALALSAVFFRISQVALYAFDLDPETNYGVSLWVSLAASIAAGEALLRAPVSGVYAGHALISKGAAS
jgi:hypothetical protein